MDRQRTTTPPRQHASPFPFGLLAIAVGAGFILVGAMLGWPGARHHSADNIANISTSPTGTVDAADGDPAMAVPVDANSNLNAVAVDTSRSPSLRLQLALPDLDPDQSYWLRKARVVARCPLCVAVDKPPIPQLADNDNAYAVWLALIWTESRFQPWAVSSIGCQGLGQLCYALESPDTDALPELNLYTSAQEFARLMDANGGDYMAVVRSYKGVTTSDTTWQANSIFDVLKLGDGK